MRESVVSSDNVVKPIEVFSGFLTYNILYTSLYAAVILSAYTLLPALYVTPVSCQESIFESFLINFVNRYTIPIHP